MEPGVGLGGGVDRSPLRHVVAEQLAITMIDGGENLSAKAEPCSAAGGRRRVRGKPRGPHLSGQRCTQRTAAPRSRSCPVTCLLASGRVAGQRLIARRLPPAILAQAFDE